MTRAIVPAFLLALIALSVGCGSDETSEKNSENTGGAGGSGGTPSDDPLVLVPPTRLDASAATDCPAAFQTAPSDGQHAGYDVAGEARSFLLRLPSGGDATPRPLLVAFNGTGETGQAIYDRAHLVDFVNRGFIVVAPDSAGHGTLWPVWDGLREPKDETLENLDLDYFDSLVKCLAAHHSVDAKRIYVAGHSAGGIFANRVLRARSQLLAGGIPASGIFDFTAPEPPPALYELSVLVTWGGDDDAWSGTAAGAAVPEFNFVEQAALASQYYEKHAEQAHCRGKSLGHAWLDGANGWMIDYLLAHPKGLAKGGPWKFQAPEPSANFECSDGAATFENTNQVTCGTTKTETCRSYCQLIGDCAAENATVEPVLGPELEKLGFSGPNHLECGGCLSRCETDATAGGSADQGVLDCFAAEASSAQCGGGIPGAMPFVNATNKCCPGQTASQVCKTLCTAVASNSAASALFGGCADWK